MRIYPVFIPHAGCPHRCLFCQQQRTVGSDRTPSPADVSRELAQCLPVRGDGEVAFYGGTFTLLPEALQSAYLDVVTPFITSDRVAGIRVSTRPDAVTADVASRLRDRGVTTVELGCQSFSDKVLHLSGRGHGPEEAVTAVAGLRSAGLAVGLQLMPGLPGADRAEAFCSLDRALALKPDFLRIYPVVVLRDTFLAEWYRSGTYRPLALEEAVDWCAAMLWLCRRARTPVIRLGLQATPELDCGEALVAGPYHPAFGQLVRSRLWHRALEQGATLTGVRQAAVHPSDLADALGHRRVNLEELRRCFGAFSIKPLPVLPREGLVMGDHGFNLQDLAAYE